MGWEARGGGLAVVVDMQPRRPARWLYGEGVGVQVWTIPMTDSTHVAVLIGAGAPVILLRAGIVDTDREWPALSWALRKVASSPKPGVYVRVT